MNYAIPDAIAYAIIVLNIGLPILLICVGLYMGRRREKQGDQVESMDNEQDERQRESSQFQDNMEGIRVARNIDLQLNAFLKHFLSRYFMIFGLSAMVGLCIMISGWFVTIPWTQYTILPFTIPSTVTNSTANSTVALSNAFAGWGSWQEFLDNCCCYNGSMANSSQAIVREVWFCKVKGSGDDGKGVILFTKVRKHPSYGSGLNLRNLCERDYNATIVSEGPIYDSTSGKVRIKLVDGANATQMSLDYLW
jgi:hypothetical protein